MPRTTKPAELTINPTSATENGGQSGPNTGSPIGVDLSSFGGDFQHAGANPVTLTSLPPLPSSPPTSPSRRNHQRDPSKNFLSGFRSRGGQTTTTTTTTTEQEQQRSGGIRQVKQEDEEAFRPGSGGTGGAMSKIYHLRKNPGSTPELSLVGSAENLGKTAASDEVSSSALPAATRQQPSPHHSQDSAAQKPKEKAFRNPLARSKSLRRDSETKTIRPEKPVRDTPVKTNPAGASEAAADTDMHLKFPQLSKGKEKERRAKSSERSVGVISNPIFNGKEPINDLPPGEAYPVPSATSHVAKQREKEKSGFMSGSKNAATKAAKGSGNIFTRLGKIGRSSSNTDKDKDIPDSEYVPKVINLPLVEQTRITRISKDLGSCRDKTEYWMPSLPWRCIDYLNLNCESEGLYRIPGSNPQVKRWQRRFDTILDIDLLSENNLYDPNNIGSMLKSWLRELPTEIMPAALQTRLATDLEREMGPSYKDMGQPAPQLLRNALSELPPFNYYTLFALTCHLSLLLSHKEKNKMDLNNLSICIGPCLKLDRWLFNYLVGDWRHCWQGCFTEKRYLEEEKMYEQGVDYVPPPAPVTNDAVSESNKDRSINDSPAIRNGIPANNNDAERSAVSSSSGSGSGNGDNGSQPTSQHDDAHAHSSTLHDDIEASLQATSRTKTSAPVETYKPFTGLTNGNAAPTVQQPKGSPLLAQMADNKRPSTAERQADKEKRPSTAEGKAAGSEARTPVRHTRSQSETPTSPTTPVQQAKDYSFPNPVHTTRQ